MVRLAIQRSPLSRTNKSKLCNFFARDLLPDGEIECVVPVEGGRPVRFRLDLRDWIQSQLYYWSYHGYEQGVTRLMRRLLLSRPVVFDVGANVGYYTFLAAALLEGRGWVHAFEPWDRVFRRLEDTTRRNRFDNVVLNRVAVSDVDGMVTLHLPRPDAEDEHLSNASLIRGFVAQATAVEVSAMRLESYCRARRIERVDLLKVDAEGSELMVLRGLGELLGQWQPDLVLEVLEPRAASLEDLLRPLAYRRFLITDERLVETESLSAHPAFRDYYLSVDPVLDS